jgi:hypothetical protein
MEVVQLLADHYAYYPQAAEFSKTRYTAPLPEDADVVIVNSYPSDVSYTFVRKAMKPIRCAPRSAMKVVIGSMHEGLGHHGLFQQGLSDRIREYRELYNRISVMSPGVIMRSSSKTCSFEIIARPSLMPLFPHLRKSNLCGCIDLQGLVFRCRILRGCGSYSHGMLCSRGSWPALR